MKLRLAVAAALLTLAVGAQASKEVKGYTKKDGTHVDSYHRSDPDKKVTNNYSFSGNTNPYTGKTGTDHYIHSPSSPYYVGPKEKSSKK